ncbi:MAG: lysophospholipid acyltransferase family protein [Vicinamibacterales bacterium]
MSATPSQARLVEAVLTFLAGQDVLAPDDIRAALESEIHAAGPEALVELQARLHEEVGWVYSPPDVLARRIHYRLADRFVRPESSVEGLDHLIPLGESPGVPVVLIANHLSYSDANVVQILLHLADATAWAGRLTALAGPKVYTSRQRRFSSLCFGTIRVPQSTDVSSGEAVLPAREVARAALGAMTIARERLAAGDVLLLFAEGTRSRTASMQPLLPAVARYLEGDLDPWVVPVGLTGSEELFPVGVNSVQPARLVMRIGEPARASALGAAAGGDRKALMDAVGARIAALLPTAYRGVYGGDGAGPGA